MSPDPAGSAPESDSGPSGDDPAPSLDVVKVSRGDVLVLRGVHASSPDQAHAVRHEIEQAVGHDEFALLWLAEGSIECWDPGDVADRVRALLVEARQPAPITSPDRAHPEPIGGPRVTSSDELRGRAR